MKAGIVPEFFQDVLEKLVCALNALIPQQKDSENLARFDIRDDELCANLSEEQVSEIWPQLISKYPFFNPYIEYDQSIASLPVVDATKQFATYIKTSLKVSSTNVVSTVYNEEVGFLQNGLLVLNSSTSDIEWNYVQSYVDKNNIQNEKINRRTNGLYHSYVVFNGTPFRVDHSLFNEPTIRQGYAAGDPYAMRGYCGLGTFGNVKCARSRQGEKIAVKIYGITSNNSYQFFINERIIYANFYREEDLSINRWRYNTIPPYAKGYLKMPFIKGLNGFDVISNKGKFTYLERLKFALSILKACQKLHQQGYIHRDIKPENFILNSKNYTAQLIDMGVRIKKGERNSELVGTPGYIAPEVFTRDCNIYTERSDVYSAGMTIKELLYFDSQMVQNGRLLAPNVAPDEIIALCNAMTYTGLADDYFGGEEFRKEHKGQHQSTATEIRVRGKKYFQSQKYNRITFSEAIPRLTSYIEQYINQNYGALEEQSLVDIDTLEQLGQIYFGFDFQKAAIYFNWAALQERVIDRKLQLSQKTMLAYKMHYAESPSQDFGALGRNYQALLFQLTNASLNQSNAVQSGHVQANAVHSNRPNIPNKNYYGSYAYYKTCSKLLAPQSNPMFLTMYSELAAAHATDHRKTEKYQDIARRNYPRR